MSRCTFDVLSVRSVVKLLIVVTRADHRLREVNGVVCVRQSALRQQQVFPTLRNCKQEVYTRPSTRLMMEKDAQDIISNEF